MKKNRKWAAALLLAMAMLPLTVAAHVCEESGHELIFQDEFANCYGGHKAHYLCENCGALFADVNGTIPVTEEELHIGSDHSPLTYYGRTQPTCLAPGLEEYWVCGSCGNTLYFDSHGKITDVNPPDPFPWCMPLTHDFEYKLDSVVLADDYTSLQVTAACIRGCTNSVRVTMPCVSSSVQSEPTCTEDGLRVYWAWIPVADFLEQYQPWTGYMSNTIEYKEVLKGGHVWNDGVVTTPAACETDGVKTFACTREGCDETKTEPVSAIGHSWGEGVVTTPAACEADGVKTFACTREGCGGTRTEPLSATGHSWGEGVVTTPAACEADGVKTFACTREGCGGTRTEPVSATGHAWGEWQVVAPATTRAEGLERCVCANNAGHTQERKIDRLPAPTAAPERGNNGGGNQGNVNANGGLSLRTAALALAASSPVLVAIAGK